MRHPANYIDMTGKRFHRLLVVRRSKIQNTKSTSIYWDCICDCGNSKSILGTSLRGNKTKSCGCLSIESAKKRKTTHGMTGARVYRIWEGIKERCLNPNRKEFKNYGGRGISVCRPWLKFENFYADMGDPPDGYCIDRRDNDGNYCPENCRWVTHKVNNNNHRGNVDITIDGVTKNVSQWCEINGINKSTAFVRILRGWNPEKAVSHKPISRA